MCLIKPFDIGDTVLINSLISRKGIVYNGKQATIGKKFQETKWIIDIEGENEAM